MLKGWVYYYDMKSEKRDGNPPGRLTMKSLQKLTIVPWGAENLSQAPWGEESYKPYATMGDSLVTDEKQFLFP